MLYSDFLSVSPLFNFSLPSSHHVECTTHFRQSNHRTDLGPMVYRDSPRFVPERDCRAVTCLKLYFISYMLREVILDPESRPTSGIQSVGV